MISLQENYSEAKIEAWLKKSCDTFPAVKSHAIYWNIKARIAERQGNTYCALDIYNEAVQNKAEVTLITTPISTGYFYNTRVNLLV